MGNFCKEDFEYCSGTHIFKQLQFNWDAGNIEIQWLICSALAAEEALAAEDL